MSQRLRKATTLPHASKPAGKQESKIASKQASLQESLQSGLHEPTLVTDVPHLISGPTIALNARISPGLMARVKAFCLSVKRDVGPEKITLQEFIACALERELERQVRRGGLSSNGRENLEARESPRPLTVANSPMM